MSLKPVKVEDERGGRWVTYEGDKAWGVVRALYLQGVREFYLPRRTILTGEVVEPRVPEGMERWDVGSAPVAHLLQRYVRLRDSVAWLQEGIHNGSSRLHADDPQGKGATVGTHHDHAAG